MTMALIIARCNLRTCKDSLNYQAREAEMHLLKIKIDSQTKKIATVREVFTPLKQSIIEVRLTKINFIHLFIYSQDFILQ